jgi:hypothetical protein
MMRITRAILWVTALLMIGAAGSFAQTNNEFRRVVSDVLHAIRNDREYLKGLSASEFRELVGCMQRVTDGANRPDKEFVLAGSTLEARGDRLDIILDKRPLDGGPTLKQKITSACA